MADWENVEPDEYKYLGCNYNPGRPQGIHGITIHHMAGDLDADDCNRVWRNAETSAHYSIDRNGWIVQHVDDGDRAWACGNAYANDTTISIEHANNNSNPWTVYDAAIESGAHLVAALCKAYGLGRPEWEVNVFPHQYWSSTACLPVKTTELLTKNGWKLLKDIEVGEEVASAVMDDLSIVWCPVRRLVEEHVKDCWLSRDLEATSEHRILAQTMNGVEVVKPWKEVCGCTSKNPTATYRIPNAGFMYGDGIDISDSELELVLAVQADGHYSRDSRRDDALENVRFHLKKERKIERLIELLDDTGYRYSVNLKKDGSTDIIVEKTLHSFCEQFLNDKHLTMEFGFALNEHQRKFVLDKVQDWDGCRAGYYYSSAAQDNLDVIQMIAALSGVGTLMLEGDRVNFKKQYRTVSNANAKRCYDKKVSCVTVDTGFILIRQHGRTTIVGNCPGELAGSQNTQYMSRAQEWYDAMVNGTDAGDAVNTGNSANVSPSAPSQSHTPSTDLTTNVHYAFHVKGGDWLPEVTNFNNSDDNGYAGNPNEEHDMLLVYSDAGAVKYQVHTIESGWLDPVWGANYNDDMNGMAGNWGETIDAVNFWFETPSDWGEYSQGYARCQTTQVDYYLPTVCDFNDYAGNFGQPIDRLQLAIAQADPF